MKVQMEARESNVNSRISLKRSSDGSREETVVRLRAGEENGRIKYPRLASDPYLSAFCMKTDRTFCFDPFRFFDFFFLIFFFLVPLAFHSNLHQSR